MRKHLLVLGATVALVLSALALTTTAATATGGHEKPAVCHPVGGDHGGNLHNGYSLIGPDQASSHIDEALYPDGHYWKHEHDGRHDAYYVDGVCGGDTTTPPSKYPYEVDACWTMQRSDGVEGTYEFPQTRGCDAEPACEQTVEFQYDTYWIRDEADENYFAGLTTLNSAADDGSLEPHDYYSVVKHGAAQCPTEPPVCDDVCNLPVFQHSKGDVVCDGALVGGTYRNVTVERGATCVLADVRVNGSVRASGARNLLVHDATIRGDVVARHVSGDVYLGSKQSCRYDPLVGGSVVVTGSHNVLICDMQVCKDVVLKGNDGKITVRSTEARRFVVHGNRHFVRDRGDSTHRGLSVIRLIHVHGKVLAGGNAPRKVTRR